MSLYGIYGPFPQHFSRNLPLLRGVFPALSSTDWRWLERSTRKLKYPFWRQLLLFIGVYQNYGYRCSTEQGYFYFEAYGESPPFKTNISTKVL